MISLVVPAFSAGPNLDRTITSTQGYCDETVIISTSPYEDDRRAFKALTDKVVELPWNFIFLHGFGSMSNQGTAIAKNDWLLLLGVAETVEYAYGNFAPRFTEKVPKNTVYRCDHENDKHTWKRVWNRTGGTQWSGVIHEEIIGGHDGGLLFRMRDTAKIPHSDAFRNEIYRYLKSLAYNWLYHELIAHPERLGGANEGWLRFVQGSREGITKFCEDHAPMLETCITGDFDQFQRLVESRLSLEQEARGVNFNPQGQPRSEGETITA